MLYHYSQAKIKIIKLLRLSLIALFVISISANKAKSQKTSDFCTKTSNLLYIIEKLHVNPPILNEEFLKKSSEKLLFSIDGQGIILYKSDIDSLKMLLSSSTSFINRICNSNIFLQKIYRIRLIETDSIIKSTKTLPLKWKEGETIIVNDKFIEKYPETLDQKKQKIYQWYKFYFLKQLEINGLLLSSNDFDKNQELRVIASNYLRKSVKRRLDNPKGLDSYLEENYLEAIATSCDPHSDYFTPSGRQQFNESLSTMVEKFGFSFKDNENETVEISALTPGSSAWNCNKLNIGDVILKIKYPNKASIDVSILDSYELSELMDQNIEKSVLITVKKKSNEIEEVNLTKELIPSEENVINGFLLSDTIPFGYITLPSFYTDYKELNSSSCANDVAKEIIKLKEENIQGLIIDLRNNGGGSIDEAINLAGIFIDQGPLFFEHYRNSKPRLQKDVNRGAIYTGPLVILINKNSASASELFSQILRSYHRAIIVGTKSFGKATGQYMLPLDTSVNPMIKRTYYNINDGYVKLTMEKLYDISGKTYQKLGITPDISIPDIWSKSIKGEDEYENCLVNDVISKNINLTIFPDSKIEYCVDNSKARIAKSPVFNSIIKLSDTLAVVRNNNTYPIYPMGFLKYNQQNKGLQKRVENIALNRERDVLIKPSKYTLEVMKYDVILEKSIKQSIEDMQKDHLILETVQILNDYIKQ